MASFRASLVSAGVEVLDIGDLCDAATSPSSEVVSALAGSDTVVCGCHHRSLRALLRVAAGDSSASWRTVDLRAGTVESGLAVLGLPSSGFEGCDVDSSGLAGRDAWYPLIDRERCSDCGRCREFCLFGVYSVDASDHVVVSNPLNCKTNCPACARICPRNAIIFPKSPDAAINGADLDPEELVGARIRLDPEEMASGDIYAKLKARRRADRAGSLPPLFRQGLFKESAPGDGSGAAGADEERD